MSKKGFATIKIPSFHKRKPRYTEVINDNINRVNHNSRSDKVLVISESKKVHSKKKIPSFNKVVSNIKTPLIPYVKDNKLALSFLMCMLLGIVIGSLLLNSENQNLTTNLNYIFNSNFQARVSQPQIYTFVSSITSSFLFVISVLLMGMSLWGMFLIPFVILFRGIGIGVSCGFLFCQYGFKGMLFSLVVILPGLLISCVALIFSAREATYFSSALLKAQVKNIRMPAAKLYLLKNLRVFILIVVSALIDVFFSWCFSGIFVFQ